MMNKMILALAVLTAAVPTLSFAEAGDWVVRARAVNISPNEDSSLGKTVNNLLGVPVMSPGAELAVSDKVIPEFDISYYITKNIAAELILALGTRHNVSITGDSNGVIGNQSLGSVNLLPPTLTAQWHFNPDQLIDPYLGAGVNYTLMLDRNAKGSAGAINGNKIKIDRDSWGYVLQGGVDVNLKNGWLLNADIKYVNIETDVRLKGAATGNQWRRVDSLDINPWVFGIGIGKRF